MALDSCQRSRPCASIPFGYVSTLHWLNDENECAREDQHETETYVVTAIWTYIVEHMVLCTAIVLLHFQFRSPVPKECIDFLSEILLSFFFGSGIELFHDTVQLLSFMNNAFAELGSFKCCRGRVDRDDELLEGLQNPY